MPKYLSPADSLIVDGTLYRPGENVPVAGDVKTRLEVAGHRFENSDEAEIQTATLDAQATAGPPPPPMDDRGAPIPEPEPTVRGAKAEASARPAAGQAASAAQAG